MSEIFRFYEDGQGLSTGTLMTSGVKGVCMFVSITMGRVSQLLYYEPSLRRVTDRTSFTGYLPSKILILKLSTDPEFPFGDR